MIWKYVAIALAIALVIISVVGCAAPNPGPCPPVKEYDQEFTNRFRQQLKTIPEGSPVAIYLRDAKELRDQVRTCQ